VKHVVSLLCVVAFEPGARVDEPASVCVSVGRLWSITEAVQGSVHAGRSHASTHWRETTQMLGELFVTFHL